ncbi:MAG TPA: OsmC family protein [Candidatus Ozemobacteraceae bacterium]|nr:OsmC family protein [Candidatus Ozemobacteraceae bacterium]
MSVSIGIEYLGNLQCRAIHEPSQQALLTDAPVDNGGRGAEFSPTDLVATALGTCLLTVMGLVAARSNIDLRGTTVQVTKEMTADPVRRIGRLEVQIRYPATLVVPEVERLKLERAAALCPVKQSLHPDVEIVVSYL